MGGGLKERMSGKTRSEMDQRKEKVLKSEKVGKDGTELRKRMSEEEPQVKWIKGEAKY